jgi:hypothetical protein
MFIAYITVHIRVCSPYSGVMKELLQHKLVFFETKDIVETTLALDNFRKGVQFTVCCAVAFSNICV